MRYYIIAGEASGDLYGSMLIKELKKLDHEAEIRFWGGDMMIRAGGTLVRHINKGSFMGFWEVLKNAGSILSSFRLCRNDLAEFRPDALILIDYPGFNLRIARFAKKLGIKVFYYISPKVWAWNQSRVKIIKRYVDQMLTIFPFETEFYQKLDYEVDYVGNPLLDAIETRMCKDESLTEFNQKNQLSGKPVIAIMAGSRRQEIDKCLTVMLAVTRHYPGYQFVIAGAPSVEPGIYDRYAYSNVPVLFNQNYNILQQSKAAMIVSGTATLEAALLGVPLVVCYRGSLLSYLVAKNFINVRYISLVNLILDKEVVKELIQYKFNPCNLKNELDRLLNDEEVREKMADDMNYLKRMLGGPGASRRAAEAITGNLFGDNNEGV